MNRIQDLHNPFRRAPIQVIDDQQDRLAPISTS